MTLGKDNTEEEVDYVVETFGKIVQKLRGMSYVGRVRKGRDRLCHRADGSRKVFTEHASAVSGKRCTLTDSGSLWAGIPCLNRHVQQKSSLW
jgi:hypothetical protein